MDVGVKQTSKRDILWAVRFAADPLLKHISTALLSTLVR